MSAQASERWGEEEKTEKLLFIIKPSNRTWFGFLYKLLCALLSLVVESRVSPSIALRTAAALPREKQSGGKFYLALSCISELTEAAAAPSRLERIGLSPLLWSGGRKRDIRAAWIRVIKSLRFIEKFLLWADLCARKVIVNVDLHSAIWYLSYATRSLFLGILNMIGCSFVLWIWDLSSYFYLYVVSFISRDSSQPVSARICDVSRC